MIDMSKCRARRVVRARQLVALLVLSACAGTDDVTSFDSVTPPEATPSIDPAAPSSATSEALAREEGETSAGKYAPKTYAEMIEEFQSAFRTPLSQTESAALDTLLSTAGGELAESRPVGRALVHDDTFFLADPILDELRADVDKGRTYAGAVGRADAPGTTPQYSRMDPSNSANYQWHKPYFGYNQKIKIIVPNTTVRDLLQPAAEAIENAADDCITSDSIDVILQSEWDTLANKNYYAPIVVSYAPQATSCPQSSNPVNACANAPQSFNVNIGPNLWQQRFVPGRYIGLDSDDVPAGDTSGTALHELMHTLGLSHSYADGNSTPNLDIPGTAGRLSRYSVMRPGDNTGTIDYCSGDGTPNPCNRVATLSDDDKRSIDVLYSPQPGSTCSPVVYETTCPLACVQIHYDNGTSIEGDCCHCNGAIKHFVKSSWSATTYLCQ